MLVSRRYSSARRELRLEEPQHLVALLLGVGRGDGHLERIALGGEVERLDEVVKEIEIEVARFKEENEEADMTEMLRLDPRLEAEQVERLAQLRESRDEVRTTESLELVRSTAAGSDNLMPAVMDAIDAEATLGEISDVLRKEWGTYVSPGGL